TPSGSKSPWERWAKQKNNIKTVIMRDTQTHIDPKILQEQDYEHNWNGLSTPLRADAGLKSSEQKMIEIEKHFNSIMETLGLDLTDESLQDTPKRVAKMFVNEVFKGLNPANKPVIKLFENTYKYKQMLVERDITVYSYCEHHFVPIIGKAHVAYISNGYV